MNKAVVLLLVPLGLAACALQETARTMDFDLALRNYGSALRWAYYDTAASAIRPRPGDPAPAACVPRTDLRVSSFQPRDVQFGDKLDEAKVRASLAYVELDTGVMREASEPQTWWYDESAKRWYVAEGIPRVLCKPQAGDAPKPGVSRP
ncbi:MAG: hypothetical protein MUF66_14485 [Gammaproteobacteria bacterium]|jgi:hypothetical protein|nr:hypothetical protein [Gammaproteobacteria bacterium]